MENNKIKNKQIKLKNIKKKVIRDDLFYETNKEISDFKNFKTIKSFGKSIYRREIHVNMVTKNNGV